MNIKEISEEIHDNAIKKGFWEEPVNIAEKLMLIVSEVAEMCEADRKNIHCFVIPNPSYGTNEDELADTVIRLLDMAKKA
jgi:NTP pyrophosphatase (non-canonical NTP hydrolase)